MADDVISQSSPRSGQRLDSRPKTTAATRNSQMTSKVTFRDLLRKVHRDERGAVSLETILIIGAIAIPILIFLIKFGWPRIRDYFNQGLDELEEGSSDAAGNGGRI
jgi:Flp pilus assembly pilin Flp